MTEHYWGYNTKSGAVWEFEFKNKKTIFKHSSLKSVVLIPFDLAMNYGIHDRRDWDKINKKSKTFLDLLDNLALQFGRTARDLDKELQTTELKNIRQQ